MKNTNKGTNHNSYLLAKNTNKGANIFNAADRIREQGDIFTGVLGKGIDLEKALKHIDVNFGGD